MFTLTKKDIGYLSRIGNTNKDIAHIQTMVRFRNFCIFTDGNDRRISRKEAIRRLGREKFLAGLSRACFHWSASQTDDKGEIISFDASKYHDDKDENTYQRFVEELDKSRTEIERKTMTR